MPVNLRRWKAAWQAELFIRGEDISPPSTAYWSRITQTGITHYLLADSSRPEDWRVWLDEQMGCGHWICQIADLGDKGFNLLAWVDGQLQLAFYAGENPPAPDRAAVVAAFSLPPDSAQGRLALLAGRSDSNKVPTGAIICSCFSVGEIPITDAVRGGCHSVQQLGCALKCGTQCGSCIPELKKIIVGQLALLTVESEE